MLICLPLLITFIVVVAILGMRPRIAFAKKVFKAYEKNKIEYEPSQSTKKRKKLMFLQLILIFVVSALSVLIAIGILKFSVFVLGTYLILILASVWIGHVITS
jgi:uncharacterized membrane protein